MSGVDDLTEDNFEWSALGFLAEEFYEGFVDRFFGEQPSYLFENITQQERSHFAASFLGGMEENVCSEKAFFVEAIKKSGLLPENLDLYPDNIHREMCKISMAEFFARAVEGKPEEKELKPEFLNVARYTDRILQDELEIVSPTFAKLLEQHI